MNCTDLLNAAYTYTNCHHRQIFDDIKESLNDFLYGKADERLKDDLCTYMINIVSDYKKAKNQSKKEKHKINCGFLEANHIRAWSGSNYRVW